MTEHLSPARVRQLMANQSKLFPAVEAGKPVSHLVKRQDEIKRQQEFRENHSIFGSGALDCPLNYSWNENPLTTLPSQRDEVTHPEFE
ncbi:MAG: hypothetical protein Unbinned3806contig1000_78 [Prokaryotic dsDNA virus sp.]|nr:MAG: hypothetical protein Unbinned3806contig1000_78 [Prokaryotic dsDNA virus sp.]|tara:strand:+ start:4868 stop:5131 length:264 start_codon:yes stop_codon:yes gene_type:complete